MSEVLENLFARARLARREHRLSDAKQDLVEAVDIGRKIGTALDLAKSLAALGQIERDQQDFSAARALYAEAVTLYRSQDDTLRLAHTIRHLGDIHRHMGERELAEPCYREALNLYRTNEAAPLDVANALRGFAILQDDAGEIREAKLLWEEARALYSTVNVEAGVAESTRRLERGE